jgi:hypothetical protein
MVYTTVSTVRGEKKKRYCADKNTKVLQEHADCMCLLAGQFFLRENSESTVGLNDFDLF